MADFFEKRDPWGHGLALWVLLGMAFVLPIALWGLTQVHMENDVEHWLSEKNLQTRQFEWYEGHFHVDQNFLLAWEGSHVDDPRLEKFARRILGSTGPDGVRRGGLKQIKGVRTPNELLARMTRYGVTREEALNRIRGVLAGPGDLKVRLTSTGENNKERTISLLKKGAKEKFGLDLEVRDRLIEDFSDEDEADSESSEETVADSGSEAPAEFADADMGETESDINLFHDFQIAWPGMHSGTGDVAKFCAWAKDLTIPAVGNPDGEPVIDDCFAFPGAPAALVITLSEVGLADRAGTFVQLKSIAGEMGIPEESMHFGGSPVAGSALNQEVLKAAWDRDYPIYLLHRRSVIALSGLVGIVLAFWLMRSSRLAALVLAVSYYTTIVSVALVPATGGSMNMVLVVMPTLLLVVTLSGAVHVANYWIHAAHDDPRTAIVKAVRTAARPCLLASVTTAIGLASLMTSNLAPVRDFGFYSAVGSLVGLGAVLYGLPALLQVWPGKPPAVTVTNTRFWRALSRFMIRYSIPVSVFCLIGAAIATAGLQWFRTETKVIRYFADSSRVVQDYNYLEQNLAGIVPVETVIRFNTEAQEELNFLDRMELVRRIQAKMRELPDISGTISLADFQPLSEPLAADAGFREKLSRNARSRTVEERALQDVQARNLFAVADDQTEFNDKGDELWRITAQVAVMSKLDYRDLTRMLDELCQSETKYVPGTRHVVTGMVPLFLATQKAVLDSLIVSFGLAFALITVVMMVLLKHPVSGLISMLPNLFPVGVVFGLMSWCDQAVDVGTMITASVGLGIAVDGTLHLITWFRNSIQNGSPRYKAVILSLVHCGPAMTQTSVVIGVGLAMLYPAELLLISRFGWLMTSLIVAALIGDVILLPCLLAGPLGMLIERVARTSASAAEDPATKAARDLERAPLVLSAESHPVEQGANFRAEGPTTLASGKAHRIDHGGKPNKRRK